MITALLAQIWPYLLAAVGAIAAVLGFGASQRAAGRKQVEAQKLQDKLEAKRKSDELVQKISDMDDGDILSEFDRLHDGRKTR